MGSNRILELIESGISPVQAVDYVACEECGYSRSEWARRRDVPQPAVTQNVGRAKEALESEGKTE